MERGETMADFVDLRSDTVTRPTDEMYEAMRSADLGDDVLGDDPTVTRLEGLAAGMLGKEAALFMPSGTMSNQVALASHCERGDAAIFERESHMLYYEVGATSVIAGVVSWTLPSDRGAMDPAEVARAITVESDHTPGTTLLCVENTHNRHGGAVIPIETLRAYREIAQRTGIRIHMDGARVFNASVASGVPVSEIAATADSVSVCLSKGLRSPVGTVLCGPRPFIDKARRWRKRLGGGMRQSGLLAACGIVSLTRYVDRLADDHRRAKRLAAAINELRGIRVDMAAVQTNMVIPTTDAPAERWQAALAEQGVACLPTARHRVRFVLHADVDDEGLERAVQALRTVAPLLA